MADDSKAPAEWAAIGQIREWPKNPKPHPDNNVAAIARSIARFGFIDPLTVWRSRGWIAAGHGRARAAALLMREDAGRLLSTDAPGPGVVPVRFVEFASEAEFAAYAIADNRLTEINPMDGAAVADILQEIADAGGDVQIPGYEEAEIAAMLADEPSGMGGEDGGAEAPPVEAVSRNGEVYELGPHRLVCGDCTDPNTVASLMRGSLADATLTDPPYGQSQPGVTNDEPEMLPGIVSGCASNLPMKNGVCVAFSSPRTFPAWLDAVRSEGHTFERMLWMYKEAQNTYPWRGWLLKSEAILVTTVGNGDWNDVHPYRHDCYKISEVSGELDASLGWHGSVKPIAIVADICERICTPGSTVYEPFGGSGTTLIACAKTGRIARVIEIDPRYCDVIRRRWTKYAMSAGVDPGPGRLD